MMTLELCGIELLFDSIVYKVAWVEPVHGVGEIEFELDGNLYIAMGVMRYLQLVGVLIDSKVLT
jgi:hypothetical protein